MATTEEHGFLTAIEENPGDVTSRLAYADWLEEHDRRYEAMLQRVQAGVSEVRYLVRRKSDGLISEGGERHVQWTTKGKEWKKASSARAHLAASAQKSHYGGTPWSDVEIVVYEVRTQLIGTLPYTRQPGRSLGTMSIILHEPTPASDENATPSGTPA
jgi:uncharacterized protein (TIGR02996 family)